MISRISRTFAANRLVIATGVLDLLLTIALIPVGIFPHAFDKNASAQFLVLTIVATLFGLLIIKRRTHFVFTGKLIWALWFTAFALIASALMSPDFIGSLTGTASYASQALTSSFTATASQTISGTTITGTASNNVSYGTGTNYTDGTNNSNAYTIQNYNILL